MEEHSQEAAQAWRKSERRKQEMEKITKGDGQKSEDAGTRKVRKVENTVCFLCFVAPMVKK